MNTNLKAVLIAAIATLGLAAGTVQAAGDITVRNDAGELSTRTSRATAGSTASTAATMVPTSGCSSAASAAHNQFTWTEFFVLLDPNCKHPVVKFMAVRDGEPAPTMRTRPHRRRSTTTRPRTPPSGSAIRS